MLSVCVGCVLKDLKAVPWHLLTAVRLSYLSVHHVLEIYLAVSRVCILYSHCLTRKPFRIPCPRHADTSSNIGHLVRRKCGMVDVTSSYLAVCGERPR